MFTESITFLLTIIFSIQLFPNDAVSKIHQPTVTTSDKGLLPLLVMLPANNKAQRPLATASEIEVLPPLVVPPADKGPFASLTSAETSCDCELTTSTALCGPPGKIWMRIDYLLWWINSSHLPPLITEDRTGATAGNLNSPGTVTLFGDDSVNGNLRSGIRSTLGFWLNREQTCGIEGNFFYLESRGTSYQLGSDGTRSLGRPFFNVALGVQDVQSVSFLNTDNPIKGSVAASAGSSNLFGGELNYRHNMCCGCTYRIDFLAGYRFLRYDEGVRIQEDLEPLGPDIVPGTKIQLIDGFNTHNTFHGGNIGLVSEFRHKRWFLELVGKVALGCTSSTVNIDGATKISVPDPINSFVAYPGGLLALSSNMGHHRGDSFSVVPEVGIRLGYQVNSHIRLSTGYTFLYWNQIARAGDQIDLGVNPNLIPGINPGGVDALQRPAFGFNRNDLWSQGLNFGLGFRF